MKYWKNGEIEIAETIMETLGLTTEQEKVMRRTLANLDDVLNDARTSTELMPQITPNLTGNRNGGVANPPGLDDDEHNQAIASPERER